MRGEQTLVDIDTAKQKHITLQRMDWLDYAKAIGITLVVLGHVILGLRTDVVGAKLHNYLTLDFLIYTFHMPLFFFASGVVFSSRLSFAPNQFIRALAIGVVVPYTIWSAAFVLMQQLVSSHVNHLYNIDQLGQIWLYPIGHMWFLYALFFIQIGFYLGYRIAGIAGMAVVACFCFFSYTFPGITVSVNWLAPGGVAMGGTFFALGFVSIAVKRIHQLKIQPSVLLIFGIVIWAFSAITMLQMPDLSLLGPIAAAAGVLMTVAACLMLPRAHGVLAIVALIGQASIAIYVAHTIFGAALRIFLYRAGVTNCDLHVISETAIGIVLPTVLFVLFNRFAISPYIGFGRTQKLQYLALARASKTATSP
jgi:fucose 4-O-acetylase-like acetyltransferase